MTDKALNLPAGVAVPHQDIYRHYAADYDLLRSRMDYAGNLAKEINNIFPVQGCEVIELAAGTGRITGILSPLARYVYAFDLSESMIRYAKNKFQSLDVTNVAFAVADNMHIPVPDHSADMVIEGWSLGYIAAAAGNEWRIAIDAVIAEMERLTRQGGCLLILGTLGTGTHQPKPPNQVLAGLYHYLEQEKGFSVTDWFKTDYLFDSVEEAERLTTFFWSRQFGDFVKKNNLMEVPECTAIWYKKIPVLQ